MSTSMAGYVFQEYPKWVGSVLVHDAAEERAHLLGLTEPRGAAVAQLATAPSAAAVRMRRSRQRRREGQRTIICEVSAAQIETLAAAGFLDLAMRDDAVLQVLQEQWDPTFSEHSYGFRPGRGRSSARRWSIDGWLRTIRPGRHRASAAQGDGVGRYSTKEATPNHSYA